MEQVLYFAKKLSSFAGKMLYVNILGMVLVSFLEGIGVFLIIPLISTSGMVHINTGGTSFAKVFELLQGVSKMFSLSLVLGIYILLIISQTLLKRTLTIQSVKILIRFINQIRLEVYQSLLESNWSFFIKKRKSHIIHSLTDELGRVSGGTNLFLQLLSSFIFTIIQVAIAFWLSAQITAFVLFLGIVLTFFSKKFIKRSKKIGQQTSDITQNYLSGITEHFNGIKDIKSNTLEESRYAWLVRWCQTIEKEKLDEIKLKNDSQSFYKISMAILIAIFIYMSIMMFQTQLEQLLLIVVIFFRLWPRITNIQSNLEQIASSVPAFKALIQLQRECKEAKEINLGSVYDKQIVPMLIEQGITCRNVFFRYQGESSSYALRNINLQIPANCMTAIVGRSGAGKSTLIDILMGLMQPESGDVLVDEVPLSNEHILSFRKSISYVPQDPFLFNASIKENLQIVAPEASVEQIWEALRFSAADFVKNLPQGLDTIIGDRGVMLSGGERQRLVLARAILRRPSILVLDEATSALDTENEEKIQEAIERLKGKMTIIVIAHRLSTIRNAEQVIVLDEGRIMQQGNFMQLTNDRRGLFRSLLIKQTEFSDQVLGG